MSSAAGLAVCRDRTRNTGFHSRVAEVAAFVAERRRWPSLRTADIAERGMAQFLAAQRAAHYGGASEVPVAADPMRRAILDEHLPGWDAGCRRPPKDAEQPEDDPGFARFAERVEAVAGFVAENRHWPSPAATDRAERSLGQFVRNQRSAHLTRGSAPGVNRSTTRRELLDRKLPGWDAQRRTMTPEADRESMRRLRRQAREVADFISAHGHWPGATDADESQRRLAVFIRTQRQLRGNCASTEYDRASRAVLDELLHGWDHPAGPGGAPTANTESAFEVKVGEVAEFVAAHRVFPRTRPGDPVQSRMNTFITRQRAGLRRGELSSARRAVLDAQLPGWDDATGPGRGNSRMQPGTETDQRGAEGAAEVQRATRFERRVDEVAAFVAAHGRFPSYAGDAAERSLRAFVVNQRAAYLGASRRNVATSAQRRATLDDHLPGWDDLDGPGRGGGGHQNHRDLEPSRNGRPHSPSSGH